MCDHLGSLGKQCQRRKILDWSFHSGFTYHRELKTGHVGPISQDAFVVPETMTSIQQLVSLQGKQSFWDSLEEWTKAAKTGQGNLLQMIACHLIQAH